MTLKFIYYGIIVPLSILFPIFFGILNWKKATLGARLLFIYLVISGLINLSGIILIKLKHNNLPLLHLYTIVEAVFILSYFRTIFIDPIVKKALLISTVLFPILCILNFVFLQSIYTFNTHTRPLEAILITFFCFLYLYKSEFTESWLEKSTNWFIAGILIYFPAACIIFILSNYLVFVQVNKAMLSLVWVVHSTLVLIMYLLWTKGFSLLKNER